MHCALGCSSIKETIHTGCPLIPHIYFSGTGDSTVPELCSILQPLAIAVGLCSIYEEKLFLNLRFVAPFAVKRGVEKWFTPMKSLLQAVP